MATLKIKNINGTWDKIPILGSAAAVVEAKNEADRAEQQAEVSRTQADRAKSEADRAKREADRINSDAYYTKSEANNLLDGKADTSDLTTKADKSTTYTKTEVDTKCNGYLPLSGGTMTGDLSFKNGDFSFKSKLGNFDVGFDYDSMKGAGVAFRGHDWTYNTNEQGAFLFYARNGEGTTTQLIGKPNGSLTWGYKEVERVEESGNNYIRYANGLQVCWGKGITVSTSGSKQGTNSMRPYYGVTNITFPAPFVVAPSVSSQVDENIAWWVSNANNISATSFDLTIGGDQNNVSKPAGYIAIGRWK